MEEDGLVQVPDEDFQAACMDLAARALSAASFERYEVASYAQPGHRCRHNIAYWTGMPYLGLGRSAAGMFDVGCGLAVAASPPACGYAQPGHRCRHNIAYWTGMPYLGLGRSAAGMFDVGCGLAVAASPPACAPEGFADLVPAGFTGRVRFKQLDDAGERFESELLAPREAMAEDLMLACRMTDGIGIAAGFTGRVRFKQLDDAGERFESELLAPREAMAEDLMLACRMTDGIGIDLLKRAAVLIPERELRAACEAAVRSGLATWDGRVLAPTHLGWLEGNELFGLFWTLAG